MVCLVSDSLCVANSHQNTVTTTNDLHAASYVLLTLVINLSAEFYGKIIRTNAGIHSCEM